MNKPISVGQPLLYLNKTIMDKFHYGYMQLTYESKIKLCYMDKDSFAYEIKNFTEVSKKN